MTRKALARRIAEVLFNERATRRAPASPQPEGLRGFWRVLCCSSVKDHSGYSPSYRQSDSDRRAPSQNSQQRCYTSHGSGALIWAVPQAKLVKNSGDQYLTDKEGRHSDDCFRGGQRKRPATGKKRKQRLWYLV